MTCIAAIIEDDTIWMGCDTMVSFGYLAGNVDTKIVKKEKENLLIGFAGRSRDINLLRFGFEAPQQDKKVNDYEYMATKFTTAIRERLKDFGAASIQNSEEKGAAHLLIGYKNNLYNLSSDFSVIRVEGMSFYAIGSGMEVALGSLYSTQDLQIAPEERLKTALSAASEFIRSVGSSFVIEHMKFA